MKKYSPPYPLASKQSPGHNVIEEGTELRYQSDVNMAKRKQTKSELTRQSILVAAAKVVGKIGYAKASVTRITMEAGIASGGFYYYFKSREDMFDELLPVLGKEMMLFISDHLKDAGWGIERETRAFEMYLAYLRKRPEFYRVFSEAYVYASSAYKKHLAAVVQNFAMALQIQKSKGCLNVRDDEIVLLAYFLLGIRNYVSQLYMERVGKMREDFGPAIDLYRKLIAGFVFRMPDNSESPHAEPVPRRPKTARASADRRS